MENNIIFDVTLLFKGTKVVFHGLLPFLPKVGDQIKLDEKVYIVQRTVYDLSECQNSSVCAIPAEVMVRMKTDNDF